MKSRLRVLWTHNFDPRKPGSQVFLRGVAEGVRRCGVELDLEYLGNLRSAIALLRAFRNVRRMSADYDVVHSQYGSACGLATSGAVVPKVLSLRGNDWSVIRDYRSVLSVHSRLARAMTRASIGRYECILTVSDRMGEEVRQRYPGLFVRTFPSPIDLTRFVVRERADARAELGFEGNDEKWILFNAVDLRDPVKRFPLANAVFSAAQARSENLRLRVATGLPHGELPLFVAACDLILCTSETEGWPNSVKEALACNVPFVSTDVSDLRRIAEVEPSCRVCAATQDDLVTGVLEALSQPPPHSLRRHVESMSMDAACEQLVRTYEGLAG